MPFGMEENLFASGECDGKALASPRDYSIIRHTSQVVVVGICGSYSRDPACTFVLLTLNGYGQILHSMMTYRA